MSQEVDLSIKEQYKLSQQADAQMDVLKNSADRAVTASAAAQHETENVGRHVLSLNVLAAHFNDSLDKA